MPDKFAVASKPPGKVAGFFRQIKSRKSLRKLKDTSVKDENDRKHVPPLPSALPPKLELLDLPIFSGDFRSLSQSLDSNASSGSQHRSPAGGLVSTDEADGGLASLLQLTSFAEGAHLYDRDLYSSTESTASTAPACSFDRQSSSVGEDDAVDEYGSASSVGHDSAPTSPKMMTVSFLSFPLTVPRSLDLTEVEKSRIASCTMQRLHLGDQLSPLTFPRREPSLRRQLVWHSISRRLDPSSPIGRSFPVPSPSLVSPTSPALAPHALFGRLPALVCRPSFVERSFVTIVNETGAGREDIVRPPRRRQGLRCSKQIAGLSNLVSKPLEGDASPPFGTTQPRSRPLRESRPGSKESPTPTRLPTLALNDEELVPTPRSASPQGQGDNSPAPFSPTTYEQNKRFSYISQQSPPRKPVLPGPLLLDAVVNNTARPPSMAADSPTNGQSSWTLSDSDDDKPLAILKERSSPKRPHLKLSPSSFPISPHSRSLPHSPLRRTSNMQDQLVEAQQRTAQLEAEMVRLRRRGERHEREKREREDAEREKGRQRWVREQRRRSEAMVKAAARTKGEGGRRGLSKTVSSPLLAPNFAATTPNLLGSSTMFTPIVPPALPASTSYPSFLPVPVLVPAYTPSLQASISAPDLRHAPSQQYLAPPSPGSPFRPPPTTSRSAPPPDKQLSLQPPPPALTSSTMRFGEANRRRSHQPLSPTPHSQPLPESRSIPNVLQPLCSSAPRPRCLPPQRSRSHPQLPVGSCSKAIDSPLESA